MGYCNILWLLCSLKMFKVNGWTSSQQQSCSVAKCHFGWWPLQGGFFREGPLCQEPREPDTQRPRDLRTHKLRDPGNQTDCQVAGLPPCCQFELTAELVSDSQNSSTVHDDQVKIIYSQNFKQSFRFCLLLHYLLIQWKWTVRAASRKEVYKRPRWNLHVAIKIDSLSSIWDQVN